jgi:hypothetical protein
MQCLLKLKDSELLSAIKVLVHDERALLVKILQHLREIERRRLYSDLGYSSLYDYAVLELGYSEGQANRRITAMRTIKELPEVEAKIASGELNLSNVQQAQTLFREWARTEPQKAVGKSEKLAVLARIENKSVRDAQKELIAICPKLALPAERERLVTEDVTEVRFLMNESLKAKLDELRSLLGPKGASMSYVELFDAMSDLSLAAVKAKKFGKKRSQVTFQIAAQKSSGAAIAPSTPKARVSTDARYVSAAVKHLVWKRDRGCCTKCGSRRNLNYDHIRPVALGGLATPENLRLLCFGCNQRASIRNLGFPSVGAG